MAEPRRKYVPRPKVEKIILLPPTIPRFIAKKGGGAIPVSELTDEQVDEIGKKWTEKLRKERKI